MGLWLIIIPARDFRLMKECPWLFSTYFTLSVQQQQQQQQQQQHLYIQNNYQFRFLSC